MGAFACQYNYTGIKNIESDIKEFVNKEGAFDGVVFAVMHSEFKPLKFVTSTNVHEIMDDNYGAFVEVMRVLIKNKGLNEGASVVALSSISSFRAMKAKMAFCSSKAALDITIKCLALELANKGIRINSIQKGAVETDLEKTHIQDVAVINNGSSEQNQPLGLVKAEEIANLTVFLLSDATRTMTGTSIVIDGGYTL